MDLVPVRTDRSKYILVGTIRRYKDSFSSLLDWKDSLPVKYPVYALGSVEKGDFVCWTKEEGLFIIKDKKYGIYTG